MDAELLYMLAGEALEYGNPYIVVGKTAAQALSGNTAISWDTTAQYTDSTPTGFTNSSIGSSAVKIPVNGLYLISGNITIAGSSSGTTLTVGLGIGATAPVTTFSYRGPNPMYANSSGTMSGGISIAVPITSNTYVSLIGNASGGQSTDANAKDTWMSISYLAPI